MHDVVARIRSGSALLWWSGVVCLALTALFLVMSLVDPVMITGVRRWIKPAKFCISFVFYFWTLAWMLPVLLTSKKLRRVVALSGVIIMAVELAAIALQAARGVPSHFNNSTPLNAAIYAIMGLAISTNTIILLLLAMYASFVWKPDFRTNGARASVNADASGSVLITNVSAAERTGISCGLWVVVLGSVFGILISVHGAHAIGVAEDALGLPMVGWKRAGGDLRVAHFFGLHGFQAAPFVAQLTGNRAAVYAVSVAWAVAVVLLFRSAMAGTSIWPM